MEGNLADPTGQGGAVEMDAGLGQYLRLSVQRTMVCVFGHRDMRQLALSGQRALDQPGPGRCLGHAVGAGAAGIFRSDGHDHADLRRGDVQPFCAILANPVHLPAAEHPGCSSTTTGANIGSDTDMAGSICFPSFASRRQDDR